jgi:hemolysin activation/secretion protein
MRPADAGQARKRWRHALAIFLALLFAAGAQALAQTSADSPEFEIRRYEVVGNSLLAAAAIESALAPHTGPARSFADVRAAVDALQREYGRRGFGAVQVSLPEQRVADGVVRLAVAEPPLRMVTIKATVISTPRASGAACRRCSAEPRRTPTRWRRRSGLPTRTRRAA